MNIDNFLNNSINCYGIKADKKVYKTIKTIIFKRDLKEHKKRLFSDNIGYCFKIGWNSELQCIEDQGTFFKFRTRILKADLEAINKETIKDIIINKILVRW